MIKILALVIVATMVVSMSGCSIVEPVAEDSSKVNESIVVDASTENDDSNKIEESTSSTETSTTESSTENSTVESTTKKTETTTVESTTKTKETTTKPAETTKAAHTHNWKAVYKTIHHNAEYKEEKTVKSYTVSHQSSKFRDGTVFDPYDYNYDLNAYNNAVDAYQIKLIMDPNNTIDTSFSCPAVYHTISAEVYNAHKNVFYTADPCEYNTVKTLVKDAYDEKVVDHYECNCGATK